MKTRMVDFNKDNVCVPGGELELICPTPNGGRQMIKITD